MFLTPDTSVNISYPILLNNYILNHNQEVSIDRILHCSSTDCTPVISVMSFLAKQNRGSCTVFSCGDNLINFNPEGFPSTCASSTDSLKTIIQFFLLLSLIPIFSHVWIHVFAVGRGDIRFLLCSYLFLQLSCYYFVHLVEKFSSLSFSIKFYFF